MNTAQSAAQKAAQNRLIAAAKAAKRKGLKGKAFQTFVGNATRGKGGGGKKTGTKVAKNPGGGGGGGGSTALTAKPRSPAIGLTYQTARSGMAALSPLTDGALDVLQPGTTHTFDSVQKRIRFQAKANQGALVAHEIIVAGDAALDKKMGQAAAISRGSVSAIAPEAFAIFRAWERYRDTPGEAARKAQEAHRDFLMTEFGFDPFLISQNFGDPDLRTYRLGKHLGQVLRWLRGRRKGKNFIHRATEPVQKLLGMVGGAI